MTTKLQSLDQGIIKSFKFHGRRILDDFDSHSSILKIVTQTTIRNCFKKAGFGKRILYDEKDEIPLAQLGDKIIY